MSEYHDWLGQPIEVGSPVLYAISEGHFAKVVWGEVLEILPLRNPDTSVGGFRNFKLKVQPYFENVDVLRVRAGSSATRASAYHYSDAKGPGRVERRLPKPAILKNVEKVTVFPLPEGVREEFDRLLFENIDRRNRELEAMPRPWPHYGATGTGRGSESDIEETTS